MCFCALHQGELVLLQMVLQKWGWRLCHLLGRRELEEESGPVSVGKQISRGMSEMQTISQTLCHHTGDYICLWDAQKAP